MHLLPSRHRCRTSVGEAVDVAQRREQEPEGPDHGKRAGAAEHHSTDESEPRCRHTGLERPELIAGADEHALQRQDSPSHGCWCCQGNDRGPDEHADRVSPTEDDQTHHCHDEALRETETDGGQPEDTDRSEHHGADPTRHGAPREHERHRRRSDADRGPQPTEPDGANTQTLVCDGREQGDCTTEQDREEVETDDRTDDRGLPDETESFECIPDGLTGAGARRDQALDARRRHHDERSSRRHEEAREDRIRQGDRSREQESGQDRPDDDACLPAHRAECHHSLGDRQRRQIDRQRPNGRPLERPHHTERKHETVDRVGVRRVGADVEEQTQTDQPEPDRAGGTDQPTVESVGDGAGEGGEHCRRQELGQTEQPQAELVAGHVEHLLADDRDEAGGCCAVEHSRSEQDPDRRGYRGLLDGSGHGVCQESATDLPPRRRPGSASGDSTDEHQCDKGENERRHAVDGLVVGPAVEVERTDSGDHEPSRCDHAEPLQVIGEKTEDHTHGAGDLDGTDDAELIRSEPEELRRIHQHWLRGHLGHARHPETDGQDHSRDPGDDVHGVGSWKSKSS